MAAVALALRGAGLRPILLANPTDAPLCRGLGLAFRPVGPAVDLAARLRARPAYMGLRGGALVVRDFFARLAPAYHLATLRAIAAERPRAVVAHFGCFGAAWAARRAGLPLALVHLAPMTWLNPADTGHGPPGSASCVRHLLLPLIEARLGGILAPAARAVGLPAGSGSFAGSLLDADCLLGLWWRAFRPPRPDDPPRGLVCGAVAPPGADAPMPGAVERFLAAGPPPVAVGLGTTAVHVAGRLWDRAVAACRRLGLRCLLVCGDHRPRAPGPDLCAVPRVSYPRLFPRCALVVHHGGAGTTMAALAAGRPQLVLPFAHDQFDNGARVRALGCGAALWRREATPPRLARCLARVLEAPVARRAEELGRRAGREGDGAAAAARAVVELGRSWRAEG